MSPEEPPASDGAPAGLRQPRRGRRPKVAKEEPVGTSRCGRAPEGLAPASIFDQFAEVGPIPPGGPWCCFFVTCLGGLEALVQDEIADVFGAESHACGTVLGKVYLTFAIGHGRNDFQVVAQRFLSLRTIEGVYWVLSCQQALSVSAGEAEPQLRHWAAAIDWGACRARWATVAADGGQTAAHASFRCTGKRVGAHRWTSEDAQKWVGGTVQGATQWQPDMTRYQLEVLVSCWDDRAVISVKLSGKQGLGRRDIIHCGKTTLRASLSHCLLRCAALQPGDVLLDPMCGSGAIPLEAALSQRAGRTPQVHIISGDIDPNVLLMVTDNVTHGRVTNRVDVVPLDSCRLPFRTGVVDAIVTDLPFGKRIGSFASIQLFYPAAFEELARVCRPGCGRAVVLTQQCKTALRSACGFSPPLWTVADVLKINHGGLLCAIITLQRTDAPFERRQRRPKGAKGPH